MQLGWVEQDPCGHMPADAAACSEHVLHSLWQAGGLTMRPGLQQRCRPGGHTCAAGACCCMRFFSDGRRQAPAQRSSACLLLHRCRFRAHTCRSSGPPCTTTPALLLPIWPMCRNASASPCCPCSAAASRCTCCRWSARIGSRLGAPCSPAPTGAPAAPRTRGTRGKVEALDDRL